MYSGEIKVLAIMSWLRFLVDYNVWHLLCGLRKADPPRERCILLEFWQRFRKLRPTHEVFKLADSNRLDLSRCAPLMVHGDEGRGRKKCGFLVLSFYSYIGYGTQQANQKRKHRAYDQMRLNYSGSTFLHRFITAVLPKMLKDECALKSILDFTARQCCQMLEEGLHDRNGHHFTACCLQVCGDWQWLVKAGQLGRSYSNCPKRPVTVRSRQVGICHICQAGQPGVAWENYRSNTVPDWWATMHVQSAFVGEPAMNRVPYIEGERAAFYTYDLFHSFHLGVGKSFVAGCLALASEYMFAGNVDARLEQLSSLWLSWSEENHEYAYIYSITSFASWLARHRHLCKWAMVQGSHNDEVVLFLWSLGIRTKPWGGWPHETCSGDFQEYQHVPTQNVWRRCVVEPQWCSGGCKCWAWFFGGLQKISPTMFQRWAGPFPQHAQRACHGPYFLEFERWFGKKGCTVFFEPTQPLSPDMRGLGGPYF